MKILFLSRLFWPHIGGVEKHVEKLGETLIKRGHEVTILTTKFEAGLKDSEDRNRVKILRFIQPKVRYLGLFYTWYWLIKNLRIFKESDVIHIHDVFVWYWPIRFLLPFKKVFVTFHGQWGRYPLSRIDILQKKIAVLLSFGSISIGEYIPKHYGIKTDLVSYGASTSPNNSNTTKISNKVLYVGRLDKELPVIKILKLFRKLKKTTKFNIEICGDGELADEAKRYGNVHGFVDPNEFYKSVKYVFASGYLTIIEALTNKCLVFVAYDNLLQADYYNMTPFRKFVICEKDYRKLYRRFLYYQGHPKVTDRLINEGYRWAIKQTWGKLANQYMLLWKETLKFDENRK